MLKLTYFKVDYCMNKKINLCSLINNSKKECNCRCCNDKTDGSMQTHKLEPWRRAGVKTSLRVGTEKRLHFEDKE